jgi:2-polyprenyl-3-methyl-5-hydroxy-6-metoxy-1,4-benzoquinol methylase
MSTVDTAQKNWLKREEAFFDRDASALSDEALRVPTPADIERYKHARKSALNEPKDALFTHLLPLEGKRALDYGCGHGEDACLLAACGAQVTAFDLSPVSIAQAQRRADLHNLGDQIRFDVRAAGSTGYEPGSFDIITGFAILHHLHQCLPEIYKEIDALLAPHGTAYFLEPVANSSVLRGLRRLVPVKTGATPDERQLYYKDFEPLKQYFSRVEFVHFYCLERMYRILGKWCMKPLRWLDYQLQRFLPFLRRYFGIVMVIARR